MTTVVTFTKIADKKEYPLLEQAEYCLTLSHIDEVEGQYGDRLVWKFLVSLPSHPFDYIARDDGEEKSLWAFTDPEIVIGSLAHQFAEALTGRALGKDADPPTEDDLIGKRLIGYVGHETPTRGKSAGIKRETIVAGTIKPYRTPRAQNGTATTAPPAYPIPADDQHDAGDERDLIVLTLKKRVARLLKLDPAQGKAAQMALEESELDTAPLADLERLSNAVAESITAALDA